MSGLLLGTGTAILTPPLGTPLAGYGADRPASEVLDDLELRAFWFQETAEAEARAVCLVTADILGFTESLTTAIRAELTERFDLAPDAVLLAASHTHSGPQTCENMSKAGGPPVPDVLRTLRQRLVTAVGEARGTLRPVTLHVGHGHLEGYAINRRVLVNGQAVMAPNPEGARDDEVLALSCRDAEGRIAAVLFHYTCHPTT
ncbi:MAG TPA: neutral/alkaline non-lysosomal ceramidase N-terminal domain-containing protein, partial [Chthonomonadaceae bacterium]|nr:neutral/alkaline non-lysosomal ceramidase N-terminal domain-containing protein [Chthonomonadaceae bacterium]